MMRGRRLSETRAQATIEMAAITPVLIVLALIAYNVMTFMAATARFDRVAPDIVLAHGVTPPSGEGADGTGVSDVTEQLERAMGGYSLEIEVVCEQGSGRDGDSMLTLVGPLRTYRCIMRYRPWPSGLNIAGVELGAPTFLVHERPVTVDSWRPGVIV